MKTAVARNSTFDLRRIERLPFLAQVVFRHVLGSTNDLALELAAQPDQRTPLLVLAERQMAGRGRGSNRWWSARGSLTFSLLLHAETLDARPDRWPQISLAAAAAVCQAIREVAPELESGIRWPNDVYLAGRKVCGILPESISGNGPGHDRLVIGIGINVNNSLDGAPPGVNDRATSLADLTGRQFSLTDLLLRVLRQLADRLREPGKRPVDSWSELCLLRGHAVELDLGPCRVRGLCQGIDPNGGLLLAVGSKTQRFFGGVVTGVD